MIKSILILNDHGKPRLTKFFERVPSEKQQELVRDIFTVLSTRAADFCSFIEDEDLLGPDTKLVYRHFATLYFVFLVDESESELGILDLIQVFVETLDKCFENVCELDLVFNFPKVHVILDEMVMGGQVLETNSAEIVRMVTEVQRLEKSSEPLLTAPLKNLAFGR